MNPTCSGDPLSFPLAPPHANTQNQDDEHGKNELLNISMLALQL